VNIVQRIEQFNRPEGGWQEVPEGWEPLAAQVVGELLNGKEDSLTHLAYVQIEWDVACDFCEICKVRQVMNPEVARAMSNAAIHLVKRAIDGDENTEEASC
jgi:predicted metal-binding protein